MKASALVLAILFASLALPVFANDLPALEKQAAAGDADAQFLVGRTYLRGDGVAPNDARAVEWFRRAAEQGQFKAQHNFAALLLEGRGVARDDAEAARWLRKAADQGSAPSQVLLGDLLLAGRGGARNVDEGLAWYRRAADQGDEAAQFRLAEYFYFPAEGAGQPDYVEAARWYRPLAERGRAVAQNAYGVIVERGFGETKANPAEAARWFLKAARQGDRKGQSNLGRLYFEGNGVKRDPVQAYAWLKVSADRGEATAKNLLIGVEPLLSVDERTSAEALIREYAALPASP